MEGYEETEYIAGSVLYNKIYEGAKKKTAYNVWADRCVKRFKLIENEHFYIEKKASTGGRPSIEYFFKESVYKTIEQREQFCVAIKGDSREESYFFEDLFKVLNEIKEFDTIVNIAARQFKVGKYFVDCYIPNCSIAIEYDEDYHRREWQRKKDEQRDREIKEMGISTIRVKKGKELEGIGQILNFILECIL